MSESCQKTRVLFVCRQNKVRSLTAEHLYRVRPDLEVRSAGTATFAKNQLSEELLEWADSIFVFDDSQLTDMERRFGKKEFRSPVICLGLPDTFQYKSQNLILKLTDKLEPYLGRPTGKPGKTRLPSSRKPAGNGRVAGGQAASARSLVIKLLTTVGMGRKKPQAAE